MTVGNECTCPKCGVIHLCDIGCGFTEDGVVKDNPRGCHCNFASIDHRLRTTGRDPKLGFFCLQCGGVITVYCICENPIASTGGNVCLVCGKYFSAHNEIEQHKKNIEEQMQLDIEDIIADVQKRPTMNEAPKPENNKPFRMSDADLIAGIKTTVENFNILADEAEQRGLRVIAELHPMLDNELKVTILKEV